MKSLNKLAVDLLIIFFLFIFTNYLFAKEYFFQCKSESVPEEAKGIYKCSNNNKMFYITPDRKTISLFDGLSDDRIKTMDACSYAITVNDVVFATFDKFGNFYFSAEGFVEENGKIKKYVTFIYKYNPVKNEISTFRFRENTTFHDLCISDDGRWIFINITEDVDRNTWGGFPKIYGVETSFDKTAVLLYSSYFDFVQDNMIFNVCFDSNTKSLNFCNLGWNQKDDSHAGFGFYSIYPDENGAYKPENLVCRTGFQDYFFEKTISNAKKGTNVDYKYILDVMKYSCHSKIPNKKLQLDLSYFKDAAHQELNGNKYVGLYAEDSNGNPLKETDAIKHIISNKNLFFDFLYTYNKMNSRTGNLIPLDLLIFDKDTNQPAWKYDKDYMDKTGFNEVGFLYSNKDGLWELVKEGDGTVFSSICHIADKDGNPVGESLTDGKLKYTCISAWNAPKPLIVTYHGLTFITIDNKKIYHYEDGIVSDVSNMAGEKQLYDYDDLAYLAEKLEIQAVERDKKIIKETKEEIEIPLPVQSVKAQVESSQYMPVEINDSDEELILRSSALKYLELEKKEKELSDTVVLYDSKLKLASFAVIVLFAAAVILFLILVINFSAKNKQLRFIKNNKKFIYNIQENERGKISRDIHDSVIQDIRAIRIETELLKVDSLSEERKNKVINLATDCVVKLRNICYNLTPAELTTHNQGDSTKIELISIIQSLVIQFIERTHVPCQIKIDENFDYPVFPKEISQNLFRIIQEALNNIEKHSYATNCQILIKNKIENDRKYMLIYISDDGIGCDIKQILNKNKKNHFGLGNMMDRAELIGAKIDFQSEQGQGMEVRIMI